jgi:uncharacterized protein YdeI (YjbR/CyaY-like superfamily)
MAAKLKTLDVRSRARWRAWLDANHRSANEIWLVFHKPHTGKASIDYEDSVEEAICFGWVDSLIRRLDDDRYARKFTPRKTDSFWSDPNRKRYAKVEALGLLAAAGRERAPSDENRYPPRRKRSSAVPAHIEKAFKADPRAWATFERLTRRERIMYVGWIDNAKREETRARRIQKALALLIAGKKLGLV